MFASLFGMEPLEVSLGFRSESANWKQSRPNFQASRKILPTHGKLSWALSGQIPRVEQRACGSIVLIELGMRMSNLRLNQSRSQQASCNMQSYPCRLKQPPSTPSSTNFDAWSEMAQVLLI